MTTELPRYVFARDARHWRAYDNKNLVFVASAPFRKSKAEARADAKALNDAAAEAERSIPAATAESALVLGQCSTCFAINRHEPNCKA